MEESILELFLVAIAIIASIVSAAKKSKAKQDAVKGHQAVTAARQQAAQQRREAENARAAQPAAPASRSSAAKPVITPTVHPHVEPDCDVHDAPGSLGFVSTEGKDPCHEDQLTHPRSAAEDASEKSGLTLEWSGENMVKAFVMQEVLTRPCQRRSR